MPGSPSPLLHPVWHLALEPGRTQLPSPLVATWRVEESQTFLWRHVGQGVVFAPFPSSVSQRGGGAEHDLCLVLLVALLGELGHLRREQVEECSVAVLADAIGRNGPFVHAQALPNDPALNQWVEPIILEDLGSRRSLEVSPQPQLPCSFSPHLVARAGATAMLASVSEPGEPVKSRLQRQRSGWESPAPTPQVQAFKKGAAGTPRTPVSQPGWGLTPHGPQRQARAAPYLLLERCYCSVSTDPDGDACRRCRILHADLHAREERWMPLEEGCWDRE